MKKISARSLLTMAALVWLAGCSSMPAGQDSGEIATMSDQTEVQRRAQIRMQLAIGYYQQGQMTVALDEIKQALQTDPKLAEAYSVRGLIYMDMGERRLAEESFRAALSLAPNNPNFSNNYGWFLCQSGREDESIAHFETAIKNQSYQSPAKAMNNAGVCSLRRKNITAAQHYLSQAFELDAGNPETNANLALVHQMRGDNQRASFYLQRALKDDRLSASVLWTAIRVERGVGDRAAENSLVTQLRRRYPNSPEYAAYLRGAFNE